MKKKIIFFTGARSEYGIMKSLLKSISNEDKFEYSLYVSGMHFLEQFGSTINEIKDDGMIISREIDVFPEDREPNEIEFSSIMKRVTKYLNEDTPDAFFIAGDRIESYAAAIGAHFAKIPIIHIGGGNITEGSRDNIYRFNITNLSDLHLATSKKNFERLKEVRVIDENNIFFTGSYAIDAIFKFQSTPTPIHHFVPELEQKGFCLMTFHSSTKQKENIAEVMDACISLITHKNMNVLLTYPNNDEGYIKIIDVILKWKSHNQVFVREHLGATGYYAALNNAQFIIGNSSSGIIEAPYFQKPIINVGSRQEGRVFDKGVYSVNCDIEKVKNQINDLFKNNFQPIKNNNLFGDGKAVQRTFKVLKNHI